MIQAGPTQAVDSTADNFGLLVERAGAPLFVIGGTPVTIASIFTFIGFILLAVVISAVLQRVLVRVYRQREIDEGVQYALNRLLHYVVLALGVFLGVDNLGISLAALAAVGGVLLVGIGFGLQNIAQNFVSGLILLLERPIKKGDFVEVGATKGTVRDIRARATVVTTLDSVDILVPNGQFITEAVINSTFRSRLVRVHVNVGVAYGSDTVGVKRTLESVAREHPAILKDPPPQVRFKEFGASSLDFGLLVWVSDAVDEELVASDLRFAIDLAFREAGIEIPFPQRDLHLKSGFERLRESASGG